jgi:hypothetical protein
MGMLTRNDFLSTADLPTKQVRTWQNLTALIHTSFRTVVKYCTLETYGWVETNLPNIFIFCTFA